MKNNDILIPLLIELFHSDILTYVYIGVSDPYLTPDIQADIHKGSVLKILPTPYPLKTIIS